MIKLLPRSDRRCNLIAFQKSLECFYVFAVPDKPHHSANATNARSVFIP